MLLDYQMARCGRCKGRSLHPCSALCCCVCPQVAVYSPADRLFPHRYNADESYQVGSSDMQPVACYLDVEAVIAIAKEAEVDAIHPGYGFLSENTTFARRCEEEGIAFIGPRADTIEVRDNASCRAGGWSGGGWGAH